MLLTLRVLLATLGVAAIAICLSIFFLGPDFTSWRAELLFDALTGGDHPLSLSWPPTMDSELRFYAPFWGSYGVLLISTARHLPQRADWVPWLALVFFAGGVGRAISYEAVGAPHPFFVLLMAIELGLPPVLALLWWRVRRPV
jgi:hypothetical protein